MMTHLLPDGRRDRIVAELRARGMLRVNELAELVGVAPVTLRRDIARLAADGVVRRLHGGAALVETTEQPAMKSPTMRVGMLVPSLDFYWPEVIRGAQDVAEERGAILMLRGTTYEDTNYRAHAERLLEAGAEGILLAPNVAAVETEEFLQWLHDSGAPFVLLEREASLASGALPFESVTTDHLSGARAAVRHLADQGHVSVGFVTNPGSPHREEIRRGWAAAIADCGLRADSFTRDLRRPRPAEDSSEVAVLVQDCLASGTTALLVHADREAIAIVQYCQQAGISVPGELSIIAYDDEVAGLFSPALTAVRPPRTSIGRAAMGLVVDRLRDAARPTHRVVITPKLNVRESTGPSAATGR
ncbi:MAG: substrate-binding domain-containing protein [Propionibacteriaceae bacterium]|nr:substrate-binding domain-containing protein [Propionibacteriaceae bacterium]